MNRGHIYRTALLLAAAVLILAVPPADAQRNPTPAEIAAAKSLGSKDAPIVMEVFSDFQCPACRTLYELTLRQVMIDYVDTGKVYLVHHDFPLAIHAHSREAARWADAAAILGKYMEVERALYAKQDSWAMSGNVESVVASVLTPAEMRKARLLMRSTGIEQAIEHDLSLGREKRIHQTPSVFVTHDGKTVPLPPGGVSYNILKQYFDYLLSH